MNYKIECRIYTEIEVEAETMTEALLIVNDKLEHLDFPKRSGVEFVDAETMSITDNYGYIQYLY